MRIAYLFSRYPAVSHTFCDTEMLAHERAGLELEIDVIRPPRTSFRHGHMRELRAPIFHAPPPGVLKTLELKARREGRFPDAMVREHEQRFGAAFKPAQRARNALYFAEALKQRGVELVHVHFANRAAHTAMFIKALSGIPFSITAHGQDFMADLGHPGLLEAMCAEASFIVAVSNFSRELLEKACPAAREKIHRVHNGIDLQKFAVSTADGRRPARLLSVGRLVPVKGHAHLVEACAQLAQSGAEFECEIVGDGPERTAVQAQIDARGLAGRVQLTGSLPQEQVAEKLAGCDAFVLPSIVDDQGATDILPTVVLEAMASARPVVATRVGGLAELVDHERTGLLVAPADSSALAEALGRLLRDDSQRAAMALAARAKAEQEFDVERSSARMRELFRAHAEPATTEKQTARARASFAFLVGTWTGTHPHLREEIAAVRAANPAMRLIIGRVPDCYAPASPDEALFESAEFLPDGMVLEAEWQEQRELARKLELWRNDVSIEGDEYLIQARWALGLQKIIATERIRHLHVANSETLPCGWIVQRLCGITLSATVEATTPRPLKQLQQLTAACVLVRTDHPELLSARDPRYFADTLQPRRGFFQRRNGSAENLRAWGERLSALAARA